jgi:hypothetical protein
MDPNDVPEQIEPTTGRGPLSERRRPRTAQVFPVVVIFAMVFVGTVAGVTSIRSASPAGGSDLSLATTYSSTICYSSIYYPLTSPILRGTGAYGVSISNLAVNNYGNSGCGGGSKQYTGFQFQAFDPESVAGLTCPATLGACSSGGAGSGVVDVMEGLGGGGTFSVPSSAASGTYAIDVTYKIPGTSSGGTMTDGLVAAAYATCAKGSTTSTTSLQEAVYLHDLTAKTTQTVTVGVYNSISSSCSPPGVSGSNPADYYNTGSSSKTESFSVSITAGHLYGAFFYWGCAMYVDVNDPNGAGSTDGGASYCGLTASSSMTVTAMSIS